MIHMPIKTWMMLGTAAWLVGCASSDGAGVDLNAETQRVLAASFRAEASVKLDRLAQDDANRECSEADVIGRPIDPQRAKALEAANLKLVKWPSDGKFLGDWKEGEKIAQSGRGLTWTDSATVPNGGNCYNCHQISKEEISFGTLGPSLYGYGKMRGVRNLADPASKPVIEYTWGKLWNARAYNACSNMPRFGHAGILDERQIQHVMALLLDPQSPVNR